MKRKIYIASSWKNVQNVLIIGKFLRLWGHEVYIFCEEGKKHYVFNAINWRGKNLSLFTAKEAFNHRAFKKAFKADKKGLDWADTILLMLPSGRSSHLEAGYAAGCKKDLFVYGKPVKGEFDVMYGFAKDVCENLEQLKKYFKEPSMKIIRNTRKRKAVPCDRGCTERRAK